MTIQKGDPNAIQRRVAKVPFNKIFIGDVRRPMPVEKERVPIDVRDDYIEELRNPVPRAET